MSLRKFIFHGLIFGAIPSVTLLAQVPAKESPNGTPGDYNAKILANANRMLEEGKQTFRFDTFGSEAFWGDKIRLHEAIAGEKNGGVGKGIGPTEALGQGLKVDADALPPDLVAKIK
jgi:hypothetical protein